MPVLKFPLMLLMVALVHRTLLLLQEGAEGGLGAAAEVQVPAVGRVPAPGGGRGKIGLEMKFCNF